MPNCARDKSLMTIHIYYKKEKIKNESNKYSIAFQWS